MPDASEVMSFVVGLTGGIGSGKSTVAELFASFGVVIVDTDAIAHELTAARGAAMSRIINTFGHGLLCADGSLDRAAMRRLVFSEPSAKNKLEAILHPLIRQESDARCEAGSAAPYVMLVVPLMIESGAYRERIDRLLVVDCDESLQISRVMTRSGFSAEEVKGIMATQATRAERLAVADDVVTNDGDLAALRLHVDQLHRRYLEISSFHL